jgi:hypothetical protein
MYNLYNGQMYLTVHQKRAYLQMVLFLAKVDQNPQFLEKKYIKHLIEGFELPKSELENLFIPTSLNDLYEVLKPITTRSIAIDLLHCLWFVASVDSIIVDDEIQIIRTAARILNISDDVVLVINNFVQDEIEFMKRAQDGFETEEVRC